MTCQEVVEFLMAYRSGELPQHQRTLFDAHLGECPECVTYIESYEATVKLGRAACADDESTPVPEALVKAILAARTKPR